MTDGHKLLKESSFPDTYENAFRSQYFSDLSYAISRLFFIIDQTNVYSVIEKSGNLVLIWLY
jgi:hypothetical protein